MHSKKPNKVSVFDPGRKAGVYGGRQALIVLLPVLPAARTA
jgi:hypothetical protein